MYAILRQIYRTGIRSEPAPASDATLDRRVQEIQADILRSVGRALAIRHLDTGSCNGCELEIGALGNPYYNIEGLGAHFVASPRHADLLLVTGPLSRHMLTAMRRTWEAMPEPRLVVAVGDCAKDGGVFGESYACCGGVLNHLPVDVLVPGCPPSPLAILQGILSAVAGRGGTPVQSQSISGQTGENLG